MGAKAIYTDKRKEVIHALILSRDIKKIRGVLGDRDRYREFGRGWQAVNLDEYIARFNITGATYNMYSNQRKIYFFEDELVKWVEQSRVKTFAEEFSRNKRQY